MAATAENANDDVTVKSIAVDGQKVKIVAAWRGVPFEMRGTIGENKLEGDWGEGKYSGRWTASRVKG